MRRKGWLSIVSEVFLVICLFVLSTEKGYSQDEKFKALFIYNFTKYIEWPASGGGNFKITVIGNSNLVNELNSIATQKKVGQSPIQILLVKSASEVSNCQIVFVSQGNNAELPKLIGKAKSNNTLIITEAPNSCGQGAGINFVIKSGTMKFEISKSNIENLGLKVSSSLLSLGIPVN